MALTVLQEEAFRRYKTLRPCKLDINNMSRQFYNPAFVNGKQQVICLTCGANCGDYHPFATENKKPRGFDDNYHLKKHVKCPNCGKEFSSINQHWYNAWIGYYVQYQRSGEWQVLRFHFIQLSPKKGQKASFSFVKDNYQIWYHPNGTRVTIGHGTSFMPRYKYNPLSQWTEMRVRKDNKSDYVNYNIDGHQIVSLAPWFKEIMDRHANKHKVYDDFDYINTYMENIRKMHAHPYFETLMKQGKVNLVQQISIQDMRLYHRQIHIAVFRNKYDIKDWSMYKDILGWMKLFNFDMHSPKYLCPEDIKTWHDKLWKMERKRQEEIRKKQSLEQAQRNLEQYQKEKGKFFCIYIPTKKFFIRPIFSPEEMVEEGNKMHHCVGSYWRHKNSLILVCRTFKDERIATIEINIEEGKIIQIRGISNSKPKQYNSIHKALKTHLQDILHPSENKFEKPLPIAA